MAATGAWTDPDGIRAPSGEVHAWVPGTNQTLCGLSLHRSQLLRFAHIDWLDVHRPPGATPTRWQPCATGAPQGWGGGATIPGGAAPTRAPEAAPTRHPPKITANGDPEGSEHPPDRAHSTAWHHGARDRQRTAS